MSICLHEIDVDDDDNKLENGKQATSHTKKKKLKSLKTNLLRLLIIESPHLSRSMTLSNIMMMMVRNLFLCWAPRL
jgi:hypothetical protein